MTKALPGKQGIWGTITKAFNYVFRPNITASEIVSETQRINTERSIEANAERDKKQQELDKIKIQLQVLHHQENLAFQSDQSELNRQFQGKENLLNRELQEELGRINREFQAEENQLNRELQAELARINREFQASEGKLNREHAAQLEVFRSNLQKWILEQQKELQLQLKTLDAELARELRIYDRQTALEVVKEQKRQNNSPIWLVAEDLLHSNPNQPLIPMRVFFSPPTLRYDRSPQSNDINKSFPEMEQALTRDLRNFFAKYTAQGRPIEFLGGAWTSNFFYGEAATRSIFRGLKTEPALILESIVEGDIFDLNFGFWGLNWTGYRYKSALSFSWREALYEFVKIRAWRWKQNFEAHIAAGKNPADFEKRYGMETVKRLQRNLEILEREQQCIEDGYDPTEIERPYSVHQNDYEELRGFLATCHCLFAGVLVDEYFLVHVNPQVRFRPLLPQLLPELLEKVPETELQELIEVLVTFYQNLYEQIEKDESGWIPELALDLAEGLIGLPQKHWAKGRVIYSIQSWLKLRGLSPEAEELESLLPVMESALMIDDIAYVGKLNSCLKQLGETHQISVINACYKRGIKRCQQGEYSAAIFDFTQVIQINHNFPEANYNRGLAYAKLGQFPAAIEDYTQALRLNPNHAEAYNNRGNAYYKLGEYEKAIADYNSALSLNPNLPGVAHNRDVAQGVWEEKIRQRREEEERIRQEEEERIRREEEERKRRIRIHYQKNNYRKLI